MAARPAAAALAALMLAGPAAGREGSSAPLAVTVQVVKSLRARTPSLTLRPAGRVTGARPLAGGVVRDATVELGPGSPAALLSLPGAPARPCAGSCEIPVFLPDGAPPAPVVVTYLPDGAPTGIVERGSSR